eukprot:jgi/Chlat1/2355/Chrsp17S08733
MTVALFSKVAANPAADDDADVDDMLDDNDLGVFANFLGVLIFVLVVAYHYVVADPKYREDS